MFGNIGPTEMIFLMVILLLVFGAKRLPELGSGLGKGIREFKKSMREINAEVDRPVDDPQIGRTGSARPSVPASTTTEQKDEV